MEPAKPRCWFYDHVGKLTRCSTGSTDKKAARARLAEWERLAVDPDAHTPQSLNDCLQTLLEERRLRTGKQNVGFLATKVKPIVTVLGGDLPISSIRDATMARRYIDGRRAMAIRGKVVSDRTIKRELQVIVSALAHAKGRGLWTGDLDGLLPPDFEAPAAKKGDTITRAEALRIFPRLTPDASAAMAFSLATGAEKSALKNALVKDLPVDISTCRQILLRGTKTQARHAPVPVVTDEQRLLLAHAKKYANGNGTALFGNLNNLWRELHEARDAEGITSISPHDLRRSAGLEGRSQCSP